MDRGLISLALLALLAAPPARASAEDAASLRPKIGGAMNAAKSFVVTTTAVTGFTVTTTFVAPDRYHSTLVYSGANRDVILIGASAYISTDGKRYLKSDAPPEVIDAQRGLRDVPVDRILSDQTAGTTTWGRFATTSAGPQKDQRLICTYDKKTFRIAECSNEGMSLVFSRYDDPANVVTAPSNVIVQPSPSAH